MVQLDQREEVLSSRFIWECTSCQTCITRCPQKVDIAAMNDALRAMSLADGKVAQGTAVPVFNEIFLTSVRNRGRVYELGLMASFKLRTGRLSGRCRQGPHDALEGQAPAAGAASRRAGPAQGHVPPGHRGR